MTRGKRIGHGAGGSIVPRFVVALAFAASVACGPAAAQSDRLDPYDLANDPYNFENSSDNFANSPYNYSNSLDNPDSHGIYDPAGNRLGYAVRRSDGVLNFFADDGERLGVMPAPGGAPSTTTCLLCDDEADDE